MLKEENDGVLLTIPVLEFQMMTYIWWSHNAWELVGQYVPVGVATISSYNNHNVAMDANSCMTKPSFPGHHFWNENVALLRCDLVTNSSSTVAMPKYKIKCTKIYIPFRSLRTEVLKKKNKFWEHCKSNACSQPAHPFIWGVS